MTGRLDDDEQASWVDLVVKANCVTGKLAIWQTRRATGRRRGRHAHGTFLPPGALVADSPTVDRKLENQQDGAMKTTLDLPNDLVQEIRRRAVNEGRKLKDVAADLLRAALAPRPESDSLPPAAVPKTLPVIKPRSAPPGNAANLTAQEFCDWIKQADFDLEVERYEKALGHQHVDRAES